MFTTKETNKIRIEGSDIKEFFQKLSFEILNYPIINHPFVIFGEWYNNAYYHGICCNMYQGFISAIVCLSNGDAYTLEYIPNKYLKIYQINKTLL